MCASVMQAQGAKSKFGDFQFKARTGVDLDERIIFPLQPMALGRLDDTGQREAVSAQFGLVPEWVDDAKGGPKFGRYCYNARRETVFEKPSFRQAILKRRGVVPVTAFYEFPDKEVPLRHRYRISRQDGQAFWLAALWESNERYSLLSCSILTGEPMSLVADFHSRSPLILDDTQLQAWLNPALSEREAIAALLGTHGSEGFQLDKEAWAGKQDHGQGDLF
jgi:putative SOS response-associated peptidase YedK